MNVRDETRHDIHKSAALRCHNRTKINIQFLTIYSIKLRNQDFISVEQADLFVTRKRRIYTEVGLCLSLVIVLPHN